MIYTITKLEFKSSSRGGFKKVDLQDENGRVIKGVAVWQDFPGYNTITEGGQVTAEIDSKQNGKYMNHSLRSSKGGGFTKSVAPSTTLKDQSIAQAQARKDDSVMTSSTIRMATDIVVAIGVQGMTPEKIKKSIMKWRYWFVDKWHHTSPIKVAGTDTDYPESGTEEIPF